MSFALVFDKRKTHKSIILTSAWVTIIWSLLEIPGNLDGRLISWHLFFSMFISNMISSIIAITIVDFVIIKDRLYEKAWYTKKVPWIAGIIYGLIFILVTPLIVIEQINLHKKQQELSVEIEQVSQVYGFILSKFLITDWCEPYYSLTVYPMKFAATFGETQYNAKHFLIDALKQNGEDEIVFKEMESMLTKLAYKTYEADYITIKKLKEEKGEQYSKKDYCKMVDKKAYFHISNIEKMLQTFTIK